MADNEEIGHYNDQNQVSITKCRTGVKIGLAFLFFYLYLTPIKNYTKNQAKTLIYGFDADFLSIVLLVFSIRRVKACCEPENSTRAVSSAKDP